MTHNPTELHTTNNKPSAQGRQFYGHYFTETLRLSVRHQSTNMTLSVMYHCPWKFIRSVQDLLIFGNFSDPRPDPTHQKAKNPEATRPDLWANSTHGQLRVKHLIFEPCRRDRSRNERVKQLYMNMFSVLIKSSEIATRVYTLIIKHSSVDLTI